MSRVSEMSEVVSGWESSGLSQREYAAQCGVSYSTFQYWRRRLSREAARDDGVNDSRAFDAIAIVDDAPAGDVTIRTPRGLVITVPLDVDVERLRTLLAAVSSC